MDPISIIKLGNTSYEVKDATARQAIATYTGLPTVTSSDNEKILQVVNGVWTLVTPVAIYSGNSNPSNSIGNEGDLYLQIS